MRLHEDEPEKVEFGRGEIGATEQVVCADCRTPVTDTYYTMGEKVICPTCRTAVQLATDNGSGAGRFLRASFLGLPAAALGGAIYYGVGVWTGYEFGLVAIVIGLMVGGAVRYGSRGRGGLAYQSLAVILTYCSIASTYMPGVVEAFREQAAEEQKAAVENAAGQEVEAGAEFAATDVAAASPAAIDSDPAGGSLLDVATALVVLFGISLAVPFLAGIENLMGLFIIGIGLYEAWQLNRRVAVEITGPHKLGA